MLYRSWDNEHHNTLQLGCVACQGPELVQVQHTGSTGRQSKRAKVGHACAASAAVFGRTPMNLPVSSRTGMLAFLPTELCTATDRLHSPCC